MLEVVRVGADDRRRAVGTYGIEEGAATIVGHRQRRQAPLIVPRQVERDVVMGALGCERSGPREGVRETGGDGRIPRLTRVDGDRRDVAVPVHDRQERDVGPLRLTLHVDARLGAGITDRLVVRRESVRTATHERLHRLVIAAVAGQGG